MTDIYGNPKDLWQIYDSETIEPSPPRKKIKVEELEADTIVGTISDPNLPVPSAPPPAGGEYILVSSDPTTSSWKSNITATDSSTGVANGGILSQGIVGTFSITAGYGFIIDDTVDPPTIVKVSWDLTENIALTHLLTQPATYICIDKLGIIQQDTSRWSAERSRQCIILGIVLHENLTSITGILNEQATVLQPTTMLRDLYEQIGFINVSGNTIKPSSLLQFQKEIGTMGGFGFNYSTNIEDPHSKSIPSTNPVVFRYCNWLGVFDGLSTANLDPDRFEDPAGTLDTIPPNRYTVQRVFVTPTNNYYVLPGLVNDYTSAENAEIDINKTYDIPTAISTVAMLIGFIIVQKGETDLNNATFLKAGKFAGGGGGVGGATAQLTLQDVYDNGNTITGSDPITINGANVDMTGSTTLTVPYLNPTEIRSETTSFLITNFLDGTNSAPSITMSCVTNGGVGFNKSGKFEFLVTDAAASSKTITFEHAQIQTEMGITSTLPDAFDLGDAYAYWATVYANTLRFQSLTPRTTTTNNYITMDASSANQHKWLHLDGSNARAGIRFGDGTSSAYYFHNDSSVMRLLSSSDELATSLELFAISGLGFQTNRNFYPLNSGLDLGLTANPFAEVHATALYGNELRPNDGSTIELYNTITPDGDQTVSLGSDSKKYNFVITHNLKLRNLYPISGETEILLRGVVRPFGSYDLASSAARFQTIYSVNDLDWTSDERLKTDIEDVTLGMDFVKAIKPKKYKWKDEKLNKDGRKNYGFLAQDVVEAYKKCGCDDFGGVILNGEGTEDEHYSVRSSAFISVFIKTFQEQQTMIDSQQTMIDSLLSRIEKLEK